MTIRDFEYSNEETVNIEYISDFIYSDIILCTPDKCIGKVSGGATMLYACY